MNKKILFLLMISFGLLTICYMVIPEKSLEYALLTKDNKLTNAILSIANITGIKHDNNLDSIVNETQRAWLRSGERWEMDHKKFQGYEKELLPLFEQLGLCYTIGPKSKKYNYGLILGGLDKSVIKRFKYLDKLVSKNIEIQELVILTGQRILTDEEKERLKETFKIQCNTETEMMVALFKQENFLQNLKNIPLTVVDTPSKIDNNGVVRRPTTADTIDYWLNKYDPKPGECLAISTQPFVLYQDTVLRTYLPQTFILETVGSKDDRELTVALYLDTLARCLYQEKERQKKLAPK